MWASDFQANLRESSLTLPLPRIGFRDRVFRLVKSRSRGTAELHFVVWEFISRAMLYIQRGIWFNSLIAAKIRRVSRKCLEFAENACKITGSLSSWCLSQDFGILREDKRFNRMFVKVSLSLLIIG